MQAGLNHAVSSHRASKGRTMIAMAVAAGLSAIVANAASAATYTWIDTTGGSWVDGTNWVGGTAPTNAPGDVADFSTLNIGGTPTITLDGTQTIGHLYFGDTTPTANWALNAGAGGPLMLSVGSGTPTVVVKNQATTINAALAGSNGLTKHGAGALVLAGANTYTGDTTLYGPVTLNYATSDASKLDDAGVLALNNATITLAGGTHAENVGATVLSGANTITRTSGTATINFNTITRTAGGTLNVAAAGLGTFDNPNTNGMLGGWATAFGTGWVVSAASGDNVVYSTTNGTQRTDTNLWGGSAENVRVTGDLNNTNIGSKTINSLRLGDAVRNLTFASGSVLTLNSGGLLNVFNGSSINGGKLTSGMSTGELFVHTPNTLTISSEIADNGSTPTVLVKGGALSLTLSGANTYTGHTYVNVGTLSVTSLAIGTITGGVTVASGATFDPDTTNGTYAVGAGKIVSGSGTIIRNINASGSIVNPGDTVGTLNVRGGLTLDAASVLNFELGDIPTGTYNDRIDLTTLANRVVTLDGTLNILALPGLVTGVQYTLISGATSIIDNGLIVAPGDYTGTITFDTSNVYLTVTTAVPEPTSIATLGLAAIAALGMRRRK